MVLKTLKKVGALMLCTLIVISSTFVCSAALSRYTISELDEMVISLPENMTAATRSSKSTDKYFSVFGLNYDTTMSNFQSGDIYLQGMDTSSLTTVTVTMTQTEDSKSIGNYNLLDSNKLAEVQANFLNQTEYVSCTPDEAGQVRWLNFNTNVTNDGTTIRAYQANTVYDGMSINITLQRNGGNVTAEDYTTFSNIVSSTSFLQSGAPNYAMIFILIGAGIVLIAVIVFLVIIVKRGKKRVKQSKNNKILEELADKYKVNSRRTAAHSEINPVEIDEAEKYDDTDIYGMYDDSENADNDIDDVAIYTPHKIVEKPEKTQGVKIYQKEDTAQNIEEDLQDILSTTQTFDADVQHKIHLKDFDEEFAPDEETVAENEIFDEPDESSDLDDLSAFEDSDDDEFDSDEVLLRQEAKKTKFNDSDDFFEEAPKKVVGVISSKDLKNAEDYDVINEVEERVMQVEQEDTDVGAPFTETLKNIGAGIKSFGTHCGYFCKNISIMMKRKKAAKKRRKAEEERRERERMRAARERQRKREIEEGGLVRVHSRNSQSHSSQSRRPQSSHNSRNSTNNRRR